MTITAHTLFQNEARWLWYSVSSVVGCVDKILLWDAGSSDNSYEIAKLLKEKYPEKIELEKIGKLSPTDFTNARQKMLDKTSSDWFLMLDGDEIWWEESIKKLVHTIKEADKGTESIVVPTINLVGDIYHYQEERAGNYVFGSPAGGLKGHFNLRAIKRDIPGLQSKNPHGTWGWADSGGKMIQDRNSFKFVDSSYLHATFLPRGENSSDSQVVKRKKKLKYELGKNFSLDFYYPEVFFKPRPEIVTSVWKVMDNKYKFRSFFETPLRKLKRRVSNGTAGY